MTPLFVAMTLLGCSDAGDQCTALRRSMALHESWVDTLRDDFVQSSELSALDLRILELELQGLRTKAIARQLGSTNASVNSRIQRMNTKLHVTNRRSAALRSLELGLVCPTDFRDRQTR